MDSIIFKNLDLDRLLNNSFLDSINKKSFSAKTSYWLAKIFLKLDQETKVYFSEKQRIVNKYAKRYDEDGETWKKGDIIYNKQSIVINDVDAFNNEMSDLLNIEFDIGISKIDFKFDKEPSCTIEEMSLLLPFIKEV